MRILEYSDLDTAALTAQYRKVAEAIAGEDFRAADVKKLDHVTHGKFYRAKLNAADRLLFALVRHSGETCALMLEVIRNHDYRSSRFLRGAHIDDAKIPDADLPIARSDAQPVRYLHPQRCRVHFLDKPLSFDDAQEEVYRLPPPLIVVGGAGSGKTALALEKLKHAPGDVLYVTQSAYLARSARDLYFAHGFEREEQDATFLSYREFVESIRLPPGREAGWREYAGWFARIRQGQAFKGIDAHQALEEIRGVLAARAGGVLSREEYRATGVRQSLYPAEERDRVYDLFEKYRTWLAEAGLYDSSLIAHEWLALAEARYDFAVLDEVQDLTTAQLALVLKTLKSADRFVLCGDSNQIVHPNFFSWSRVKSLFWGDPELAQHQELRLLTANFRNGTAITRLANTLLKIKHHRFGSIDRESNFLVESVGGEPGTATLLADQDAAKRDLDRKTRESAEFAVLVMRDEDKAAAREFFSTPLLFSIHEAKGLEYENVVLYRFVSDHRREFAEITAGVGRQDLASDTLDYRRARDKSDKALEVYKFFVNALYVAMTRAVRNLYLVESDTSHALFGLLFLTVGGEAQVDARRSSLEEWQKEAHKLEMQGKLEQADAIRRTILKPTPPPWPVYDETVVRDLLIKVFRENVVGDRQRRRLHEYAIFHDEPELIAYLAQEAHFGAAHTGGAQAFEQQRNALNRKYLATYAARNFKDVLRQCDAHGIDHRSAMNQTPLMAAAAVGNIPLVEALLARGADRDATDDYGCNALHLSLREAFRGPGFAGGPCATLYELLAPPHVDLKAGERLVRVDKHLSEYLLFQTFWTLFKSRFARIDRTLDCALDTQVILRAWQCLPVNVLRTARNKRQYLSHLLSRNEVERDYAYNRALFKRISHGWYQFNPALQVRSRSSDGEESWHPIFSALNLPLISEFATRYSRDAVRRYLQAAGMAPCHVPIMAEREAIRLEEEARREQEDRRRREALRLERDKERAASHIKREQAHTRSVTPGKDARPRWGTPEARREAMLELQHRSDIVPKPDKS
ncbi:MAG TPA: ankyrin repeat domain-containing protein [Steroidobacteraceae bacterium]|nr:ankyrin repeat domain-containing protein [Steroidobacteraceae bacterium]